MHGMQVKIQLRENIVYILHYTLIHLHMEGKYPFTGSPRWPDCVSFWSNRRDAGEDPAAGTDGAGQGACLEQLRPRRHPYPPGLSTLISLKVFSRSFCRSPFPHKSVYLSFIIIDIKKKLTDLYGNWLLRDDFINTWCEINSEPAWRQLDEFASTWVNNECQHDALG